ncbi:xanthine dehydrogenase accessory factor [Agrobacterium vitis]|nr:xanthine dehydrogenase accessory factor [Agrobacterium vitis]MBE1437130.1 xanthine dehydrogenase accessory factor [Agrobacterium vitis]
MTLSSHAAFLRTHARAVLVTITVAKGSTPREAGAIMLVARQATLGTIGGGQLEYLAIAKARAMLDHGEDKSEMQVPLGPEIGQCCGGHVTLSLCLLTPERQEAFEQQQIASQNTRAAICVFGAGHVGFALVKALAPLPFQVTLIDTRDMVEEDLPSGISFQQSAMPEAHVAQIAPGGACVIVTHDHALDFLIAREALARSDLSYVGMIGSSSKRATFAHWLAREGADPTHFTRLTMPIGKSDVRDKRPAVIAALVAAELLQRLLTPSANP